MKKILFLFATLIISFANLNAQNSEQFKRFTFGVRAGFSSSNNVKFDEFGDKPFDNRKSFNIGAIADFNTQSNFALRSGLIYNQKGFETDDIIYPYFYYNYLEIPVLAVFKFPINDLVKPEIQVGPYLACGVGGEIKAMDDPINPFDYQYYKSFKNDGSLQEKRFDLGLNIGVGVNIWKCYIGCAYELGLHKFDIHGYNQCFMINVGYNFK